MVDHRSDFWWNIHHCHYHSDCLFVFWAASVYCQTIVARETHVHLLPSTLSFLLFLLLLLGDGGGSSLALACSRHGALFGVADVLLPFFEFQCVFSVKRFDVRFLLGCVRHPSAMVQKGGDRNHHQQLKPVLTSRHSYSFQLLYSPVGVLSADHY
jgi:hypothetical protein